MSIYKDYHGEQNLKYLKIKHVLVTGLIFCNYQKANRKILLGFCEGNRGNATMSSLHHSIRICALIPSLNYLKYTKLQYIL